MAKFTVHVDTPYYTKECNHFMATAISYYPDIAVISGDNHILQINTTTQDATDFIKFLAACDMIHCEEEKMKTYKIICSVSKVYEIEAKTENDAEEQAMIAFEADMDTIDIDTETMDAE